MYSEKPIIRHFIKLYKAYVRLSPLLAFVILGFSLMFMPVFYDVGRKDGAIDHQFYNYKHEIDFTTLDGSWQDYIEIEFGIENIVFERVSSDKHVYQNTGTLEDIFYYQMTKNFADAEQLEQERVEILMYKLNTLKIIFKGDGECLFIIWFLSETLSRIVDQDSIKSYSETPNPSGYYNFMIFDGRIRSCVIEGIKYYLEYD